LEISRWIWEIFGGIPNKKKILRDRSKKIVIISKNFKNILKFESVSI
jgi:hypothetical protein